MQNTFTCIDDIVKKYNIEFTEEDKKNSDIIVDIFNGKVVLQYTYPKEIVNIFGLYYNYCLKDVETMKKCFMSAIMRNSIHAAFNLSNYYLSINNFIEAAKYLKPLVNSGHIETHYRMGCIYYFQAKSTNNLDHQNAYYNQMTTYFEIAIKGNFMDAANFLGNFYGIKKDFVKAKHYLTISANANNIKGIYKLANYYLFIEKKYDEMKNLFNTAIEHGCGKSAYSLGNFYKNIEKNYEEMEKCYIKGKELGHVLSTYELGLYYEYQENDSEMVKCYVICLKKGYVMGGIKLSNYYFKNKQVAQLKKTFSYINKIKHPLGYITLANYYYMLENNVKKMHHYFVKAYNLPVYICSITKESFNSKALVMYSLGKYYEKNGKDYQAAERCYLKSFEEKFKQASYSLGYLYQNYIHNYTLMKKYYDIAITECNHSDALNEMIKYYYEIDKNPTLMWSYYNQGVKSKIKINTSIIINYIVSKLVSAEKKDDCMICYEEKDMYFSNCENHSMCKDCSIKLYLSPCPYCRKRRREE